jgi:pimeloyl-ACP methyl ester carboxylesterase
LLDSLLPIALAAAVVAGNAAVGAASAATRAVRNIVLVRDVATDGSAWRGVYDILTRDGYHVSVVQEPLTGLSDDVAATRRVLDQQDGPVILVGHSYGGTIITVAGVDPKVRALVYVAGLRPDVGETTNQLAASMPGEVPDSDLKLSKDRFINPALARWMYRRSGAKITEIKANHLVDISRPGAVASVIERAARSAGADPR